MSLIATGPLSGHHGGISEATDPGTRPYEPGADPAGGRRMPGRHAPRWLPPDLTDGRRRRGGRHDHHHGHLNLRKLRRSTDTRVLSGLCGGIANATGIDVMFVRIVVVLISVAMGVPVLVYALAWLIVPMEGESTNIFSRAISDRQGLRLLIALVLIAVVVQFVIGTLHIGFLGLFSLPTLIGASLGVLIWRNAGEAEKTWIDSDLVPLIGAGSRGTTRWVVVTRIALGVALAGGGAVILLMGHAKVSVLRPVGGVVLVLGAFVVVFGPWWLNLIRDLFSERQARALAEERAQMAAHVHDSVLQTLALIQRASDDPQQVVRLARAQERELRSWLFDGRLPGAIGEEVTRLAEGVDLMQEQVEAAHGITVQVVLVGDCRLTDPLRALLDAAREATVNAAKWSGADQVSFYAEVEPQRVTLFVRDRGRGFDPDMVPGDRQGIAQSIRARVARHGGTVAIRSAPHEGAEVELSMPREPDA